MKKNIDNEILGTSCKKSYLQELIEESKIEETEKIDISKNVGYIRIVSKIKTLNDDDKKKDKIGFYGC